MTESTTNATNSTSAKASALIEALPKKLLIGGRWVESASGKTFATVNPATGAVIAEVAEADAEDVDRAVEAARRAFEGGWNRSDPRQRQQVLLRVAELIEEHADELAMLETLDNGKPITASRSFDIPHAADVFRYYAGWPTKQFGETNPSSADFFSFTLREPVGVCGQIIPWNFPLVLATWKLAPALACANTAVVKPAEQTPLTALRLGELLLEAGVPEGVVNILPGYGPTAGAAIAGHPGIDKVAFTGSTEVGREIVKASGGNLKRVSLELGGKSPNIVFADAELDDAIAMAALGIFYNQGQNCCAASRLFVERGVHDRIAERLSSLAEKLRIGPGIDPDTELGPLVSQEQYERVTGYLATGRTEGAKIAAGGEAATEGALSKGFFVKPTVFTDVKNSMRIAQEEIFGPVVSVIPFEDENDAVLQGNETVYGLAAGVWTNDVRKAHRVARAVRAGTVWVNCYNVFDPVTPFGGYKQSGFGRELGPQSLELYTQMKTVCMKI